LKLQTQDPVLFVVPARHALKVADETRGCVVKPPRG